MVRAVGSGGGGAGNATNNNSAIATLQKKMGDLMTKLRDATKDPTPGAKERLKLLQVQIQAVQTQIQQLQSVDAQKVALDQLKHQQDLAASAKQQEVAAAGATSGIDKVKAKSKDTTVGSVVDTTA